MQLLKHQAELRDLSGQAEHNLRILCAWEPGCGKTIGALAAVDAAKPAGWVGKTLVVAPKSILTSAWLADSKHFPGLNCRVVWNNSKPKRLKMIMESEGVDVFITNPATFKTHAADFISAGVRRLVYDESSGLKNWQSQVSKCAHVFSDQMASVILLSGTPAPNSETEYWSQMRCVDRGVFGTLFYRFANHFFYPLKRNIGNKTVVIGHVMHQHRREEFANRLEKKSWFLRKVDCLDLPAQTDREIMVELSDTERTAYTQMLKDLCIELRGMEVSARTEARLMKLRQITGGGVLDGSGRVLHLGNSKLDAMMEIMEEIGNRPVVIWAVFTNEIDRIMAELADKGIAAGRIDGTINDPAIRTDVIERFQGGRLRAVVCHPAAAGHGITLTAAAYSIFYSMDFSAEGYEQARNRVHRVGQQWPVTHYHLVAADTIDDRILDVVRGKQIKSEIIKEVLATQF